MGDHQDYVVLSVRLNTDKHKEILEKVQERKDSGQKPQEILLEALTNIPDEKPKSQEPYFNLSALKELIQQTIADSLKGLGLMRQKELPIEIDESDQDISDFGRKFAASVGNRMTQRQQSNDNDNW